MPDINTVLNVFTLLLVVVAAVPVLRSRRKDAIIAESETTSRVRGERVADLEKSLRGAQARANQLERDASDWRARYDEQHKYTAPEALEALTRLIAQTEMRSQERDEQIVATLGLVTERLDQITTRTPPPRRRASA